MRVAYALRRPRGRREGIMATAIRSIEHRRRSRALAGAGQVAGVVGIVLFLLLALGSVYVRGRAIERVDGIAQRVDGIVGRAITPIDTASGLVSDVGARFADVA